MRLFFCLQLKELVSIYNFTINFILKFLENTYL